MRVVNVMYSTSDRPFGSEKVAYKYVDLFLAEGHQVLFVHRHDYDLDYIDARHAELRLHKMPQRRWGDLLRTRARVHQFCPDIIVVHNHFSRFRGIGWGIAPMVGVAHLGKFGSLKRYEGAIAFREDLEELAVAEGVRPERIGLIPNTSDFGEPFAVRSSFRSPPIIGAIGRLSAEKNFSVFIAALGRLKRRGVVFLAELAGCGVLEAELRALAVEVGVEECLVFSGFETDVRAFYDRIDICCVPSAIESFGVVLLEAMAARKPIVASDITSFNLILDKGRHGVLFESGNEEMLAIVLESYLRDPDRAFSLAESAGGAYDSLYSESVISARLNTFIKKIAAEG